MLFFGVSVTAYTTKKSVKKGAKFWAKRASDIGYRGIIGEGFPEIMPTPALTIENVAKSFGARRVLRGVSLTVSGGEAVAVTGANGSGKSTLLKIVAGLLRSSSGTVTWTADGKTTTEAEARRALVSYAAPDLSFYPELTARENLLFFAEARHLPVTATDAEGLLNSVGLTGRGGDPVSAYSSGMKQRLRLAFARMLNAPILLLDEPSLALDINGVGLVAETIAAQRAKGGVTLLATNDPREMGLGDTVMALGDLYPLAPLPLSPAPHLGSG